MKLTGTIALLWRFLKSPKLFYIITLGLVIYLVAAPIGMLLLGTLKATEGALPFEATPFTLDNYLKIYLDPASDTQVF